MKYEWIDEYLLKKPGVTKDLQKEWNWIRYQIGGKMFAAIIDRAFLPFRHMEHLTAYGVTALAHISKTITCTAIRTAATDHLVYVTHLPISPFASFCLNFRALFYTPFQADPLRYHPEHYRLLSQNSNELCSYNIRGLYPHTAFARSLPQAARV